MTELKKKRRHHAPCQNCRRRRIACEVDGETIDANREENLGAAVRSQCQCVLTSWGRSGQSPSLDRRLERFLECLEKRSLPGGASPNPSRVELDDVVASMMNLAILGDTAFRPSARKALEADPLIQEAKQALAGLDSSCRVTSEGFVYDKMATKLLSLEDLCDRLPPWTETRWLLLEIWPKKWTFIRNALYAPDFPGHMEQLYRAVCPDPVDLADLFSALACVYSTLAVENGNDNEAWQKLQKQTDQYSTLAMRALELADYLENPSIKTLRVMHTLTMVSICYSKVTSQFERAFALFPLTSSTLYQLGLDREDPEMLSSETPMETWERRALANAILRDDLFFCWGWGRRAFLDSKAFTCPLPEWLRDEDLPPDLRSSPYRMSARVVETFRYRNELVPLRQAMIDHIYSHKTVDYAFIRRLSKDIDDCEARLPREWKGNEEFDGKPPPLPFEDRVARMMTAPGIFKLRMTLHRMFIAFRKPVDGISEDDIAYHRNEILRSAHQLLSLSEETKAVAGAYVAMAYVCYDSVLATCMILSLTPDHPSAQDIRVAIGKFVSDTIKPSTPIALRRLGRLLTFFLDRPYVREAENNNGCAVRIKRTKGGRTELGDLKALAASGHQVTPSGKEFSFSPPPLAALSEFWLGELDSPELPHRIPVARQPPVIDAGVTNTLDLLAQLHEADKSEIALNAERMHKTPLAGHSTRNTWGDITDWQL